MNCLTCKHNSYRDIEVKDFVSCGHPVTLERGPRWQHGDPAMVNYRTGDVHVSQIHNLTDCPTYSNAQPASPEPSQEADRG